MLVKGKKKAPKRKTGSLYRYPYQKQKIKPNPETNDRLLQWRNLFHFRSVKKQIFYS